MIRFSLLLALSTGVCWAFVPENPGLRARVTNKFLDGIWNISEKATKYHLKELSKGGHRMGGFKVQEIELGEHDFHFQEPNLLVFKSHGGKTVVDMKTTLRDETGAKKRGIMTVTVTNSSSELIFAFNKSDSDRLTVDLVKCDMQIGKVDIGLEKFENATDFLKNVSKSAETFTAAQMNGMFCPQLEKMMVLAKFLMSRYPKVAKIGRKMVMDMSLTSQPKATNQYLQFDFSGYIYNRLIQDRMAIQFDPHPLVDKVENDRMLYGFISDEVINQFLKVGSQIQPIVAKIENSGYTEGLFKRLKEQLDQVAEEFELDFELDEEKGFVFTALEAPKVTFLPNPLKPNHHIKVEGVFNLSFFVKPEGAQDFREVVIQLDSEVMLNVELENKAGKRLPRLAMKGQVSRLELLPIRGTEGLELSPDWLEKKSKEAQQLFNDELVKSLQEGVKAINSILDKVDQPVVDEDGDQPTPPGHPRKPERHPRHHKKGEKKHKKGHHHPHPWRRTTTIIYMRGHGHHKAAEKAISIPNAKIEFFRHTAVLAFDLGLDLEKLFEKQEKQVVEVIEEKSGENDTPEGPIPVPIEEDLDDVVEPEGAEEVVEVLEPVDDQVDQAVDQEAIEGDDGDDEPLIMSLF